AARALPSFPTRRSSDLRLGAVCALASAAAQSPRAVRLRDHQLAAGVGARRRSGAGSTGRRLGGGPPRRLDLRADPAALPHRVPRSEEHTSELQSLAYLV